jgi:hypothetical protein
MQKAKLTLVAMLALSGLMAVQSAQAAENGDATPPKKHKAAAKKPAAPTVEQQIQALHDQMQAEIDALKAEIADRDAKLQAAQAASAAAASQAAAANSAAQAAAASAASNSDAVNNLQGAVADIKTTTTTVQTQQAELKKSVEEPLAIHYKGVTLTPSGFLAAETVWRQRGIEGDINTQFSGIPYSGIAAGHLSEWNASGRQSRIGLLAEGKNNAWTYRGYYEADWLSAGVTSNDNQSNSYTLRQRQLWAQAQSDNGWYFTGGQMWSLLTENKDGILNRTEALPMTIDPQYNTGFVWARQEGFRVTKSFSDGFWVAASAEEPQTLNVGCHTPSSIPAICTAITYQGAGNTGGLYDNQANYSFNVQPDYIFKGVSQSKWGHYELEGVVVTFRDRYYPNATAGTPSAAGALNQTTYGGGIGASGRWDVLNKKVTLGYKALLGAGIERYGSSTLPQVTVKPNGALEPLRGGSMLATLEAHPTPRWDLYSNFGFDYAERAVYQLNGVNYGFGSPNQNTTGCQTETLPTGGLVGTAANCTADNRAIGELTFGYWYRFYKGKAGTIQQGIQYSYAQRSTWQGTGGSPKATDGMVFSSFRYYLP